MINISLSISGKGKSKVVDGELEGETETTPDKIEAELLTVNFPM